MQIVVLVAAALWGFGVANCVTIETAQGSIEGVSGVARNGIEYTAFLGIPFAQPPTAETGGRWQPPRPVKPFEGVFQATKSASHCLQNVLPNPALVEGDEDCLYLNVFTRHAGDPSAKKTVMVWIHGGAFIFGGAQPFRPDYVMEEDVVLVTIQYRLNMFGFLSFEDRDAPGNYGMLDQVEALKWVQKHISAYGGDPAAVTIFGSSAGGGSVHLHVLSPLSKGLFRNAIAMSGSALNWWANQPEKKAQAVKLAKHFNCTVGEGSSLPTLECLRAVPAKALMDAHPIFFEWRPTEPAREPMTAFSPRPDPESATPFLPDQPFNLLTKDEYNHVPLLMGYAQKEGVWRANLVLPDKPDLPLWKDFISNSPKLLPYVFGLFSNQTTDAKAAVAKISDFYNLTNIQNWPASNETLTLEQVNGLIDAMGDSMFVYGIDTAVKMHAKSAASKGSTYLYYLSFPGEQSFANFRTDGSIGRPNFPELREASHGTDMLLLFPMFKEIFGALPDKDTQVSRSLVKTLVHFADKGKPAQEQWKPFDEADPTYMDVASEPVIRHGPLFKERIAFWNALPDVFWKHFIVPK